MKRLLVMLLALGFASGAFAQKVHVSGTRLLRPRVSVIHVAPAYPYYGYGYGYRYSPFYDPFMDPYSSFNRPTVAPSQLELNLDEIRNNYQFQISSTRHDKSLSKQERKQRLRELRHDRETALIEAKKSYYKSGKDFN